MSIRGSSALLLPRRMAAFFSGGDAGRSFSIQSISKVFSLTLASARSATNYGGRSDVSPRVSVQLHRPTRTGAGPTRNPFINAGAIAVTDILLAGRQPKETIGDLLRFMQYLAGDESIIIDDKVARSETETGHRNAALAEFMAAHGCCPTRWRKRLAFTSTNAPLR